MDLVTIKVPRGATRGEHCGVIWVQQAAHLRRQRWPSSWRLAGRPVTSGITVADTAPPIRSLA